MAKRLSLGSSELIGLVTPEIANPFFAALAGAAEDEARQAGYALLIVSTGGDPQMEIANIQRLDSRHVDGLIVLTNRPDDGRLRAMITGRKDVVLLDEDVPGAEVARIFVENNRAPMPPHAICWRPATAASRISAVPKTCSAQERFQGFARALGDAGVRSTRTFFGSAPTTAIPASPPFAN